MKIGALVSRSGPAGLWSPSCEAHLMLAVAEVNDAGGVRDRAVELIVADAGWTTAEAGRAAADMMDLDEVDVILGMHPSNTRSAINQTIAARVPYVYIPQYEGGEKSRAVLAMGATDADVLRPTIPWLIEHRAAARFFVLGSDYVWAREGNRTAAAIVAASGGRLVGEQLVAFGCDDYQPILDAIGRSGADTLIMFLLGVEAARFNRAFAATGLHRRVLRLGLGIDETVLLAIGGEAAEELYVASSYVSALSTDENAAFVEQYRGAFGALAPPVNVFGRSCYDGVRRVADMAALASRTDRGRLGPAMVRAMRERSRSGPVGRAPGDRPIYLAVADGLMLRVIATFPA